MGFRFHRRINLGNGAGINVSKSGVSTSVRTQYGTIGTKGFSIRTGIPGLTWRSGFGGKNGGTVMLLLLLILGAFIIAYNLIRFAFFVIGWIWSSIFTEQGVNYKFLFGFLFVMAGAVAGLYYYTPTTTSAPTPPSPVVMAPPVMPDSVEATPKTEKPKRKKRDRSKQAVESASPKTALDETLVESENVEPVARSEKDNSNLDIQQPIVSDQKETIATSSNSSSGSGSSDTNPLNIDNTSEAPSNDAKKTKWYQFRKKREEKNRLKKEQQEAESATQQEQP